MAQGKKHKEKHISKTMYMPAAVMNKLGIIAEAMNLSVVSLVRIIMAQAVSNPDLWLGKYFAKIEEEIMEEIKKE